METIATEPSPAPDIRARLAAAARQLRRDEAQRLGARAVKYLLAALLAFFVIDVLSHLGAHSRLWLTSLWIAGVICVAGIAAWVARFRRHRPEHVARVVESRDPSLGSSVINYLQLEAESQAADYPPLSRSLAREALHEYAHRLAPTDFPALARSPELPRERKKAGIALAAFAGVLAVAFPVAKTELLRFADPLGDHPPFSFTTLVISEPSDDTRQIVYNQPVGIRVTTRGHRPGELFLSFADPLHPEAITTLPMFDKGDAGFFQQLENVRTDLLVFAHTKDRSTISHQRRISVILTPKFEKAFIEVVLPAYTGVKSKESPFAFKSVQALAGSEVRFRLGSNRPLSGGTLTLETVAGQAKETALRRSAEQEVSGAIPVTESGTLRFALVDVAGMASQENPSTSLTVTHDLPPDISIESPPADSFVSDDFTVQARIVATDDYGVKTVRAHRALNGVYSKPKTFESSPAARNVTQKLDFNIGELGVVSGDVISFYAEAIDSCPEPHLARSKTINLMVITVEEYNDMLRERTDIGDLEKKFATLSNELQSLIDEQKQLAADAEAARKKAESGESKDSEELNELLGKQAELNGRLNQLADRMNDLVRPKPLYDVESELQEILREKARQIRESTGANSEKLAAIPQGSPGVEPLDDFKDAAEEQLAKLGRTRQETEDEVMQPIRDTRLMDALVKDFNYFRHLYETQAAIAEQTASYGTGRELTPEDKLALKQLASTERALSVELQKMSQRLNENADAAEALFPKAAASARDLAAGIDSERLSQLAGTTANTMHIGNGSESHNLAEGLREAMFKFFGECNSSQPGMRSELDQCLSLTRGLNPRDTFNQMAKSRKFGSGSASGAFGSGAAGFGGTGYAMSAGPNVGVLGSEPMDGSASASGNNPRGRGTETAAALLRKGELEIGAAAGMQPSSHDSGAVQTETLIDEYRGVVDAYFDSITK